MNSKEALINLRFNTASRLEDDYLENNECINTIEKDLDVLEELETLKNYYEPFKQFLKEMFEKGHNEDLTKVKEWLENEQ